LLKYQKLISYIQTGTKFASTQGLNITRTSARPCYDYGRVSLSKDQLPAGQSPEILLMTSWTRVADKQSVIPPCNTSSAWIQPFYWRRVHFFGHDKRYQIFDISTTGKVAVWSECGRGDDWLKASKIN
jgi:hypothetical protein